MQKFIQSSRLILAYIFLIFAAKTLRLEGDDTCHLPLVIDCPPLDYCGDAETVIGDPGTQFKCDETFNITAQTIILYEGLYSNLYLEGVNIQVNNLTVQSNLTIKYSQNAEVEGNNRIGYFLVIFNVNLGPQEKAGILKISGDLVAERIYLQSDNVIKLSGANIETTDQFCLQQIFEVIEFVAIQNVDWDENTTQLYEKPITFLLVTSFNIIIQDSIINTTVISIFSYNDFNITNSIINTSASACTTNMGLGKGLQVQLSNTEYCLSGSSSSGFGILSNSNCLTILQYFMFLSHSFPYLGRGPYISTGSGGYGYMNDQQNEGAGGGIIFIFVYSSMNSNNSKFLAEGGASGGNNYMSAGSGGTVFIYSQALNGMYTNFSASGGPSYNQNGSGAGGLIKISFSESNFYVNESMWVNITPGYQPERQIYPLYSNGLFYGIFCPAGTYLLYLSCKPCPPGTFSTIGALSCQPCPQASHYLINMDSSINQNASQCFSQPKPSFYEIWLSPSDISELSLILYIITLFVSIMVGFILKKKFRKKLSVMETEQFNLQDAKRNIEETRMLTQKLKAQKNIKFQDLMYHVHRITLYGINTPNCPWVLPNEPPSEIQKYILLQGYIDFSERFNKIAKWQKKEKVILILLGLFFYPFYWFYYDYRKKNKYNKLVRLLQESKEFNLINNYDFQDQNMVTIKISKNTDYTICYLDFLVYDRANLRYFQLASPFIISLSGQGSFLRPFYLQDNDIFFNCLFYILNKSVEKIDDIADERARLFSNLVTQKKRQESNNQIINFLKQFNKISIALDLSGPTSIFTDCLISLIDLLSSYNEKFFNPLSVHVDLILMIAEIKHDQVNFDQIHILTNKDKLQFLQYLKGVISKLNQKQNCNFKLGLFVYNPDQQIEEEKKNNNIYSRFSKLSWGVSEMQQSEQPSLAEPLVESQKSMEEKEEQEKCSVKMKKKIKRGIVLLRYILFCHRPCQIDRYQAKFYLSVLILFQCLFVFIWAIKLQFPYVFINLVAPYFGVVWLVSDSYGFAKVYLILNSLSLVNEIVTLIIYPVLNLTDNWLKTIILQIINIVLAIVVIYVGTKVITVSKKLSGSKMFK